MMELREPFDKEPDLRSAAAFNFEKLEMWFKNDRLMFPLGNENIPAIRFRHPATEGLGFYSLDGHWGLGLRADTFKQIAVADKGPGVFEVGPNGTPESAQPYHGLVSANQTDPRVSEWETKVALVARAGDVGLAAISTHPTNLGPPLYFAIQSGTTHTNSGRMNPITSDSAAMETKLGKTDDWGGVIVGGGQNVVQHNTNGTGIEQDLNAHVVKANSIVRDNQKIKIRCWGSVAVSGANKTIRLYFGATVLAYNDITAAPSGTDWVIEAEVSRTGSAAQLVSATCVVGSVTQSTRAHSLTEDFTTAITIKVTGQDAVGPANEIACKGLTVEIQT